MKTATKIKLAQEVVLHNKGRKFEVKLAALERAGIRVKYAGFNWNFGIVGTVKGDLIQLECGIALKSRKNGYVSNKCYIYKIL